MLYDDGVENEMESWLCVFLVFHFMVNARNYITDIMVEYYSFSILILSNGTGK